MGRRETGEEERPMITQTYEPWRGLAINMAKYSLSLTEHAFGAAYILLLKKSDCFGEHYGDINRIVKAKMKIQKMLLFFFSVEHKRRHFVESSRRHFP